MPATVVEKVDPTSPSHGDIPGTAAYAKRQADAVPDIVRPISSQDISSPPEDFKALQAPPPIPLTKITRVDSQPSHGEVPGTEAFDLRRGDAKADIVEKSTDGARE